MTFNKSRAEYGANDVTYVCKWCLGWRAGCSIEGINSRGADRRKKTKRRKCFVWVSIFLPTRLSGSRFSQISFLFMIYGWLWSALRGIIMKSLLMGLGEIKVLVDKYEKLLSLIKKKLPDYRPPPPTPLPFTQEFECIILPKFIFRNGMKWISGRFRRWWKLS